MTHDMQCKRVKGSWVLLAITISYQSFGDDWKWLGMRLAIDRWRICTWEKLGSLQFRNGVRGKWKKRDFHALSIRHNLHYVYDICIRHTFIATDYIRVYTRIIAPYRGRLNFFAICTSVDCTEDRCAAACIRHYFSPLSARNDRKQFCHPSNFCQLHVQRGRELHPIYRPLHDVIVCSRGSSRISLDRGWCVFWNRILKFLK